MSPMEVEVQEQEGLTVVTLHGELDISEASKVEAQLEIEERKQPPILVLDLSPLSFLDSSGIRLVLEADMRARRDGRRLVVVRGPEQVHRVFMIALLDKRLEFVDDLSEVGGQG